MKATLVQIGPSAKGVEAGRLVLSPEMNAAVAARHSRTKDGLDSILESIDRRGDEDRAIDSVFKFIDFGHRSIADMVPISIHIEGVSLWLAEFIWGLVHTGGGQEPSTRYCRMNARDCFYPEDMSADMQYDLRTQVAASMEIYEKACYFWEQVANASPDLVGISGTTDPKKAERFKRNFVFDRARYFIPMTCLTNMNVTTWGTEWIRIAQALISSPWKEAQRAGQEIINELNLVAPRIVRHASRFSLSWSMELNARVSDACETSTHGDKARRSMEVFETMLSAPTLLKQTTNILALIHDAFPKLSVGVNNHDRALLRDPEIMRRCLGRRENRYDVVGSPIVGIPVEYGWSGVANAEIRDMNRHRPGIRNLSLRPEGFYFAVDQILFALQSNSGNDVIKEQAEELIQAGMKIGIDTLRFARSVLEKEGESARHNVVYATNLGNTFSFSHSSTLGHLIYECELRTGPGTHFRYRAHYKELLRELYEDFPLMKQFVLEGSGEPE